jgi:hypothetical protein
MISPKSTHQENRIIGLFPELLGFGGIQEDGRLTAAAVEETVAKPVGGEIVRHKYGFEVFHTGIGQILNGGFAPPISERDDLGLMVRR